MLLAVVRWKRNEASTFGFEGVEWKDFRGGGKGWACLGKIAEAECRAGTVAPRPEQGLEQPGTLGRIGLAC